MKTQRDNGMVWLAIAGLYLIVALMSWKIGSQPDMKSVMKQCLIATGRVCE